MMATRAKAMTPRQRAISIMVKAALECGVGIRNYKRGAGWPGVEIQGSLDLLALDAGVAGEAVDVDDVVERVGRVSGRGFLDVGDGGDEASAVLRVEYAAAGEGDVRVVGGAAEVVKGEHGLGERGDDREREFDGAGVGKTADGGDIIGIKYAGGVVGIEKFGLGDEDAAGEGAPGGEVMRGGDAGLIADGAEGDEGVGGVLTGIEIGEDGFFALVHLAGGHRDDVGAEEEDVNGGVVVDGALAGVVEVVQELAVGGGHGVGLGHAFDGGKPKGGEDANDDDDDEEFEQSEANYEWRMTNDEGKMRSAECGQWTRPGRGRGAHGGAGRKGFGAGDAHGNDGYYQLRMLSLLGTVLAFFVGSALPSGPRDQIMT